MKLSATLLSILTVASAVFAQPSSPAVAITYKNKVTKVYNFGECIPEALQPGNIPATEAVALQNGLCSAYKGFDCAGGSSLLPSIPVIAGESVPNLFNVAGLVAEGAKCFQIS